MNTAYDVDVVVVGGGPAGLAAATRVRWVKGYHAMASSVMICESGVPGGLLRWGSCILTGQQWAYSGEDLNQTLLSEVERLQIPIRRELVRSIERAPSGQAGFQVGFESGESVRCLAVILATGFRPLANESEHYLRGVRITYKGYDHFPSLIRACAKDAAGRGLVVVGNHKTSHLKALLARWAEGAGPVTVLDDGRLLEVVPESGPAERADGKAGVRAVIVRRGERTERIDCGAVLMDYNAFELTPDFTIGGLPLARDERGFVLVDRYLRTSEPGIFAAGDITGRYASTLMALGDGVCAGFSAYGHAFEAKFGHAPRLFAYAASDEPLPEQPRDLPELAADCRLIRLSDTAPEWIDNGETIGALAARLELDLDELRRRLEAPILQKVVTVHRVAGTDGTP